MVVSFFPLLLLLLFQAEVNVLARIWDQGGHASIIRWFGATHKALSPWNAIILESCDGGLFVFPSFFFGAHNVEGSFKYTLYVQGANLKLAFVLKVYQQVASALQFLHSHKIIHRDVRNRSMILFGFNEFSKQVKAANVLLLKHAEDTNNARLADFGLAKFKEDTHRSPSRTLSLMDLSERFHEPLSPLVFLTFKQAFQLEQDFGWHLSCWFERIVSFSLTFSLLIPFGTGRSRL